MRFFGMEIFQSGGTYSSLPSVPKNEIVLFEKDTVVLGYTLLSDVDDEVIYITKGSAAGGTAGGTDRGSWTLTTSNHTHSGGSHTHTTGDCTLTISQIPSHTHTYSLHYGGSVYEPDNNYPAAHSATYITTTGATGGGQPHNHGITGTATGNTGSGGGETITSYRPLGRCFTRQRRV